MNISKKQIEKIFAEYNKKYFASKVVCALSFYSCKTNVNGTFSGCITEENKTGLIQINTSRTRGEIKETLLHEMTHAFLYFMGLPWDHSKLFKAIHEKNFEKEFGFIPKINNPKFSIVTVR
jgi:hypothetical protein